MADNPLTGARYLIRGFALITRPGLRRFVAVPLLINAVLFSTLIYVGAGQVSVLLDTALPEWLDWLRWLLWPLFVIATMLVVFFGFAVLGNLVAAPFNGFLAEAVERHLTGEAQQSGTGWTQIGKEISRSVVSEIRKIGYFALRAGPILLLFFVPVVNAFASILWILFSAWMLALQYADYPMANHGLTFAEQRHRLRKQPLCTLGFGGAAMLALVIPVLNFLVIPASVAGATAMWVDRHRQAQ